VMANLQKTSYLKRNFSYSTVVPIRRGGQENLDLRGKPLKKHGDYA
ncbi:MAG: hypothetical protein ACI87E_003458, partial [Mariniblastus sp.]